MSILVVGSIALDTVETPYGKAEDSPGGSALYFSVAASMFTPVNVVGVVGTDFDLAQIEFLRERRVDFEGLAVERGDTFRWGGRYQKNMNKRATLFTYLNVFKNFKPQIPEHYRNDRFVFLANIDPELQLDVLEQMEKPEVTVLDTMNFWISSKRKALMRLLEKVDILIINDEELFELTRTKTIREGTQKLMQKGPKALVIKKGEHGATLVSKDTYFVTPAYPVARVVDPTGAGDSFAGGFLGFLDSCGAVHDQALRKSAIYGSAVASFTVEDFSFNRLKNVSRDELEARVDKMRDMVSF